MSGPAYHRLYADENSSNYEMSRSLTPPPPTYSRSLSQPPAVIEEEEVPRRRSMSGSPPPPPPERSPRRVSVNQSTERTASPGRALHRVYAGNPRDGYELSRSTTPEPIFRQEERASTAAPPASTSTERRSRWHRARHTSLPADMPITRSPSPNPPAVTNLEAPPAIGQERNESPNRAFHRVYAGDPSQGYELSRSTDAMPIFRSERASLPAPPPATERRSRWHRSRASATDVTSPSPNPPAPSPRNGSAVATPERTESPGRALHRVYAGDPRAGYELSRSATPEPIFRSERATLPAPPTTAETSERRPRWSRSRHSLPASIPMPNDTASPPANAYHRVYAGDPRQGYELSRSATPEPLYPRGSNPTTPRIGSPEPAFAPAFAPRALSPFLSPDPDEFADSETIASSRPRNITGDRASMASSYMPLKGDAERGSMDGGMPHMGTVLWRYCRFRALRFAFIFHIPAVLVTVAICGLYLGEVTWKHGPDRNVRGALRYASKLNEIFVAASMSQILYHHVRYHLIQRAGMSFGFVVAAFQLNDPRYLLSRQFRHALIAGRGWRRHWKTCFIIISAFLLVFQAGPSTANILVPNLQYFPLGSATTGGDAARAFQRGTFADLYPTSISESMIMSSCRDPNQVPSIRPALCPTAGFAAILASTQNMGMGSFQDLAKFPNISVKAQRGSRFVTGASQRLDNISDGSAFATTPPDFISSALNLFALTNLNHSSPPDNGIDDTGIQVRAQRPPGRRWQQPVVTTYCHSNGTDNSNRLNLADLKLPIDQAAVDFNTRLVDFSYFRDHTSPVNYNLSYGGAEQLGRRDLTAQVQLEGDSNITCFIRANWIDADVYLQDPYNPVTESLLPGDSNVALDFDKRQSSDLKGGAAIKLSADFLAFIFSSVDVPSSDVPGATARSTFDALTTIAQTCRQANLPATWSTSRCYSLFFSTYLADVLARFQNFGGTYAVAGGQTGDVASSNPRQPTADLRDLTGGGFTEIRPAYYEFVWGYKLEGAICILAIVVLLTHLAIVIAHLGVILFGDAWASRSWGELTDLLALALHSPPPAALHHSGVMVPDPRILGYVASVRETEDGETLRMVLQSRMGDDGRGGGMPAREGVAYR